MSGSADAERTPDARAWDEFCEHLKRAGRLVMNASPDDDFDRAEGLRYVGRIARHGLESFLERSDPGSPGIGSLPKLGGDNPDYVYSSAPLSPAHEYRLRGNVGDARYVGIGTYAGEVGTDEGLTLSGYLATGELATGADGSFEIAVSIEERPGNWLPMKEDTSQLMTRQTLLDRRNERLATFVIERVGGSSVAAPLDPLRFVTQLDRTGAYVEGAIAQFLEWTRSFASRPNDIQRIPPELQAGAQGDPSTHYYGGYYELGAGEALVVDLEPPDCEYWNIQLCNHWLESLDYGHHTVHVNDHTAVADEGGRVRVVVAEEDPGVANWLDTVGHRRGCMILRQVGTREPCEPSCRVVPRGELR